MRKNSAGTIPDLATRTTIPCHGMHERVFPFSLAWPVLALLLGVLEIITAVMLLKEEGAGPKLMLGGAVTGLLGNLSFNIVPLLTSLIDMEVHLIYSMTWALTALGSMLFTIGLLLYALRRRAQATRIAELEAILESQGRG